MIHVTKIACGGWVSCSICNTTPSPAPPLPREHLPQILGKGSLLALSSNVDHQSKLEGYRMGSIRVSDSPGCRREVQTGLLQKGQSSTPICCPTSLLPSASPLLPLTHPWIPVCKVWINCPHCFVWLEPPWQVAPWAETLSWIANPNQDSGVWSLESSSGLQRLWASMCQAGMPVPLGHDRPRGGLD